MARLHTVFFIQRPRTLSKRKQEQESPIAKNNHPLCHIFKKATIARTGNMSRCLLVISDLVKQNMCQGMYCRDSGWHPAEMIEI
jgi:hypothetical protein